MKTAAKPSRLRRQQAPRTSPPVTEVTVSWATIARVLIAAGVVCLIFLLGRLLALIFFALLLSLALWRVVQRCERWGWPRSLGITCATLTIVAILAGVVGLLIPAVANQGSTALARLPELQKEIVNRFPQHGPIRDALNKAFESASFSDPQPLVEKFMTWGTAVLSGISEFLVILVVAIYFLIDGERIYHWIAAFFSPAHRARLRVAGPQVVDIVSRYVGGQFITSALAGAFAFAVLICLHVPNAILLAVLAAVFDILPVIGFFLFVIPAVAVASTVSPLAAGLTALLYFGYHMLETYLIVPKVYGDTLKLSTLTVLIACMAGWLLGGVLGAIAILPVVASYPIFEKLWLDRHLETDTVTRHDAIEAAAHPAS